MKAIGMDKLQEKKRIWRRRKFYEGDGGT